MAAQHQSPPVPLSSESIPINIIRNDQKSKGDKNANDSTNHQDLSRSSSCQSLSPKSTCDLNRVHEELEKLNIATDIINKLELQLDEARAAFREIQSSWSQRLEQLGKKLGGCIEKSRPYYEARLKVQYAQQEAQRAALRFERANSMHAVAKQQVSLTQESLDRQGARNVDPACLEVLNHHIQRVNDAEIERLKSEQEHQAVSKMVTEATSMLSNSERELRRSIKKSKPYFEARVEFTKVLEKQKELIQRLEAEIRQKKADYNTSLRNLEMISEQIHEQRQTHSRKGSKFDLPDFDGGLKSAKEQEDNVSMPPSDPEDKKISPGNQNKRRDTRGASIRERNSRLSVTGLKSGGLILLAQELSAYDWLQDDTRRQAFTLPQFSANDDLDVRYQTAPEGVKPFPSPPETPIDGRDQPTSYVRRRSQSASPVSSTGDNTSTAITDKSQPSASAANNKQKFLTVPSNSSSIDAAIEEAVESPTSDKSDSSSLASFGQLMDDSNVERALKEPETLLRDFDVHGQTDAK